MWKKYKGFIITLTVTLAVVAFVAFAPHAKWKCPPGSEIISGMCVPGATKPVRE